MKTLKVNDSHVHISMDYSLKEDVLGFKWIMDETHTERINFLALNAHVFFQETQLNDSKCLYLKSAFSPVGYAGYCLDYSKERSPKAFKQQIEDSVKAGFDCWKLIEGKPDAQKQWGLKLDDEVLEPAFKYAEDNAIPIIMHVADPDSCWEDNYKTGFLPKKEYQNQAIALLERHPNLILTLAHFGFMADEPDKMAKLFEKYPNFYFDNVPAPDQYFIISDLHNEWKDLTEKYSKRFLFGTDRGNHGTNGFTREEWFKSYPETASYQQRIYKYDGVIDGRHPFKEVETLWGTEWNGLNISDEAYNDIFYNNFLRIYGEPKKIDYERLYDYAKYEFSLPAKSKSLKEDFNVILEECKAHGVKVK